MRASLLLIKRQNYVSTRRNVRVSHVGRDKRLACKWSWDLVKLPKGRKAIPNKWVYKIKTVDGKPKYKARLRDMRKKRALISKSFSLQWLKWPNYVSCFPTAALDLELFQMDVKIAFLHGDLDEELYMKQLEGYPIPGKEHLVCKLKRSLLCWNRLPGNV
mgnify:CR=1 FL=1